MKMNSGAVYCEQPIKSETARAAFGYKELF
jgi:hypothetical protein